MYQKTAFLFEPRKIYSLVFFRIAFGMIMLWEVMRYFKNDWIRKFYIELPFHFTYPGFAWVKPWSGDGLFLHFFLIGALSFLITLGLFYRAAIIILFFSFLYVFLLEQALYLNHFYLLLLVNFLLIFLSANKFFSLDAIVWKNIKSSFTPAWTIALLQFQIAVVYFFGGLAKINHDWLILAEPMQHWLRGQMDFPFIGFFFDDVWVAYFFSWSGMLLDIAAPFLLLNRKARPLAFLLLSLFHFINARLFPIGIFPWFMILGTTIFFDADWPKKFFALLKNEFPKKRAAMIFGAVIFSVLNFFIQRQFEFIPFLVSLLAGALIVWLFVDAFIPVGEMKKVPPTRHFFRKKGGR